MKARNQITRTIRSELQAYPGRTSGSLEDTLSMVLALLLAETLRVPGISLALALILLLQRESPGITFRNVVQIFAGAVASCAACLLWVQLTDDIEVFRFIGFMLGVFISGFCMAGSRLPLFFTIFGFYGFVDLAAWDTHRSPNSIVTAQLYNIGSLAIALGTASFINFVFRSRHPREELRDELRKRIALLGKFHRELASSTRVPRMSELHHRIVQLAHAGDLPLNQLYEELRSSAPEELPSGIRFRIGIITRVLERSSVVGFASGAEVSAHLCIAQLCDHMLDPAVSQPSCPPAHTPTQLTAIFDELRRYDDAARSEDLRAEPTTRNIAAFRLFRSDAFTSPGAAFYALKLTLSATLCYILYNALAWPGILTCVVTVLFTGLSSTGAMKQKQLYRLVGAAIGGLLAILVESLLMPNMDSITSLLLVAAAVCFVSAWVSRSPRMGYIGVQIAFAFFLTDLAGFSATTQLAPARDRVIGIALGTLVTWFVFDQMWPQRPSSALKSIRNRIRNNIHRLATLPGQTSIASLQTEVSADLAEMQTLIQSVWFDFSLDHHRELARSRRITRQIEGYAASFYQHLHSRRISPEHETLASTKYVK